MKAYKILSLISAFIFLLTVNITDVSCSSNDDAQTMEYSAKRAELFSKLKGIALANPDGYTVDVNTLHPVTSGYAVSVAATQNSFNDEGLYNVIDYVAAHPEINAYGGWLDTSTGYFYYDATMIFTELDEAIAFGIKNGQKAIFDLCTNTKIAL